MGFLEHLDELRKRIIRSCIAVALGMGVAVFFVEPISDFILEPTLRALPPGTELIFIRPGEVLSFYFDVSLIGGAILAAPFVMYQVWGFVAPGLYEKERKFVIPLVMLTCVGTIAGAAFSHYVMFPMMIGFFGAFHSSHIKFMPSVDNTFGLYKNLLLGMVVVFQLPTLVLFLARLRLVTARFLWNNVQYAVLIIFILAAFLTPSLDPWNQTVFAAPMIVLYLISIGIAWIARPRTGRPTDQADPKLQLVIGAMVIDQARRHHRIG